MRVTFPLSLAILAASAAALPATASAQAELNVHFARGQNSMVVNGSIRGRRYVDYLVNVRSGERLSVSMTSNNRSAYFNLIAPGQGDVAYYVGSNSNPLNRFDGVVPARGLQRIRVYLYRASGRRGEAANFQLTIAVGNRPGWGIGNPVRPQPIYPPGQTYRPGGTIECRIPGIASNRCTASVQHLGPGSAYVRIQLPNGIVRTVTYDNGNAIRIDSGPPGGSFLAQRQGNRTVVEVGYEAYWIPNALLYAR